MQTGRDAGSVEAFRAAFQGRLMALSAAHTLLTASNWAGASLRASLEQVLEPYAGEPAAPYVLAGDDVGASRGRGRAGDGVP